MNATYQFMYNYHNTLIMDVFKIKINKKIFIDNYNPISVSCFLELIYLYKTYLVPFISFDTDRLKISHFEIRRLPLLLLLGKNDSC